MQKNTDKFVDLHMPGKYSASNHIISTKDHVSTQMTMDTANKVTGRFNNRFKTYAICGVIPRIGESDDSILQLPKADGMVSKKF
uniref:40S ribosomal protein S21-like n=1 Tax=Nyctereutes procyonoides TaxID=34880 RepID=UPI00244459EE|nr:40S ribosomal protein S21-like [Nyctereutes procyonoides]